MPDELLGEVAVPRFKAKDYMDDYVNPEAYVDAQKKIFADFENRMADQAIAVNLGNYGLFQIASTKLKDFKPYRIPRMWGVWLE